MIESKLKPICGLCPALDARVETAGLYGDGKMVERVILVYCANRNLCERLEEYLKSEKEVTP